MDRVSHTRGASEKRDDLIDPGHQPLQFALPKSDRYVITYGQNATPVFKPFLESLLVYCEYNKAELIVLPGRYKNPTSLWTEKMEHDEWWDIDLHPFLFAGRESIGNIIIYGDTSIQPTATRPTSGFEVFVGDQSGIFGHPKREFRTIATAKVKHPKTLSTTGAITIPNYTKSKAGRKAQEMHIFGASIIEIDDDENFHLRQITAKQDGSFTDLKNRYTTTDVENADRPLAIVLGDIHVDQSDPVVLEATLGGKDSIVRTLLPKQVVCHDTLDFRVANHHTRNLFRDKWERANGHKKADVEAEIQRAIDFIDSFIPKDVEPVIIESNHDDAFDKWLDDQSVANDPINARLWHAMWVNLLDAYEGTKKWIPAFELYYQMYGSGRAKFVRIDDSGRSTPHAPFQVAGIDLGSHGHLGPNGTRGSILSFAKLGVKIIFGHVHSAAWIDHAISVGITGDTDQGYNKGPSNWTHTHAIVYADGERSLITVINGKWKK